MQYAFIFFDVQLILAQMRARVGVKRGRGPHARPLLPPIPTFPRQGGRSGKPVQKFMSQYLAPDGGPCTDDKLVDHIRRVLEASPFPGEGYRKVWARLRHGGLRTSPRRVLRLMRAHQLLAPTRQGHPHGPKAHDGTIIPAHVDMMWGTDMTATKTRQEGQVAIFIAVDHYSAECMGIHAAKQGTRFEALEPIRQGVRTAWGAFGQDIAQGLVLRHDHGSQYMSHVFQEELRF